MKVYSTSVYGCSSCPYFWDGSETCKHPYWKKDAPHVHVVQMYDAGIFIEGFTYPEDCPLPDAQEAETKKERKLWLK